MDTVTEIKILCIGTQLWSKEYIESLPKFDCIYHIELLDKSSNQIKQRLQHNSYDILIVNYDYLDISLRASDPLIYNKLAFAMSRPSLLVCNSNIRAFFLNIGIKFSTWLKKFKLAKNFIFITSVKKLSSQSFFINNSKSYHTFINRISAEIFTIFINQ